MEQLRRRGVGAGVWRVALATAWNVFRRRPIEAAKRRRSPASVSSDRRLPAHRGTPVVGLARSFDGGLGTLKETHRAARRRLGNFLVKLQKSCIDFLIKDDTIPKNTSDEALSKPDKSGGRFAGEGVYSAGQPSFNRNSHDAPSVNGWQESITRPSERPRGRRK